MDVRTENEDSLHEGLQSGHGNLLEAKIISLCLSHSTVCFIHSTKTYSKPTMPSTMLGGKSAEVNRTDKVGFIPLCRPSLSDPLTLVLHALLIQALNRNGLSLSILSSKTKS